MLSSTPPLGIVGAPGLIRRLRGAGLAVVEDTRSAGVVVIGGDVGDRAARARDVVSAGAHAFLLWPPGVSTDEATALGARAEEAGVEVGVARPLGGNVLAGQPDGWAARLVTLSVAAASGGPLDALGWPTLLAGALDLATTLAASRDVARLDAEADRDGARLRAVALTARFRTGAFAQLSLRTSDQIDADEVALYASRSGSRVEARSLAGPLCIETDGHATVRVAPPSDPPDIAEIAAFAHAVGTGQPVPYALDAALDTLRLVESVQARLR